MTHSQQRLVYAALLCIRLILALTTHGYIHPDEHFQSTEGALSTGHKTWEFNSSFPCRSMASVRLWNAPVVLLAASGNAATPSTLWCTTRVTYFLLSLIGDGSIAYLSMSGGSRRRVALTPLLLYASSGSVLTLGVRAFSNNVEAALLWLSLVCVESMRRRCTSTRSHPTAASPASPWIHFTLGTLVSLGIFARFTFGVFAAPMGVWYLYLIWRVSTATNQNSNKTTPTPTLTFIKLITPTILGFILTSTAHILYDTHHYSNAGTGNNTLTFTITPLNALRYNTQSSNLAQHGLHPRWLHVIVNAPMILGVAVWVRVLVSLMPLPSSRSRPSRATSLPLPLAQHRTNLMTLIATLFLLSTQPHQEPRFLYPLILPTLLLLPISASGLGFPRWFILLHTLQSVGMVLVFGVAHQAGVTPALLWVSSRSSRGSIQEHAAVGPPPSPESSSSSSSSSTTDNVNVHTWRTFMPPPHLLAPQQVSPSYTYTLVDHGSAPMQQIIDSLQQQQEHEQQQNWLLAPTWALTTLPLYITDHDQHCFTTLYSTWPHLDTDHFGEMVDVYKACLLARRNRRASHYALCAKEALSLKVVQVVSSDSNCLTQR